MLHGAADEGVGVEDRMQVDEGHAERLLVVAIAHMGLDHGTASRRRLPDPRRWRRSRGVGVRDGDADGSIGEGEMKLRSWQHGTGDRRCQREWRCWTTWWVVCTGKICVQSGGRRYTL